MRMHEGCTHYGHSPMGGMQGIGSLSSGGRGRNWTHYSHTGIPIGKTQDAASAHRNQSSALMTKRLSRGKYRSHRSRYTLYIPRSNWSQWKYT